MQEIAKLKKQIFKHEKNGNNNEAASLKKMVSTIDKSVAALKKIEAPRHQSYPTTITSVDEVPKPFNPPADPTKITVKDWYVTTGSEVVNPSGYWSGRAPSSSTAASSIMSSIFIYS